MSKIVKFGGTSLADSKQFRKVYDIIKSDQERKYVVPSAPGKRFKGDIKVTDLLIDVYNHRDNDYKQSFDVMKKYARKTPSPNSGYSMSAAAGALNITLVKEGVYKLGYGDDELTSDKITEAISLTKVTSLLFILTIVFVYIILIFLLL